MKQTIILLAIFALAVLLVAVAVFLLGNQAMMGPPRISQSPGPLSLEEARRQIDFELPDSARNVQFGFYRLWLAVDDRIRFEAPASDCIATAKAVLKNFKAENPGRPSFKLEPLDKQNSDEEAISDDASFVTPWFHPELIQNGQIGGAGMDSIPRVWVDTDKGIFYYRLQD